MLQGATQFVGSEWPSSKFQAPNSKETQGSELQIRLVPLHMRGPSYGLCRCENQVVTPWPGNARGTSGAKN